MDLRNLLESTLAGLGYELVDLELARGGLMRLFIDSPQGITVEDCVKVSNHLTRLFMVESVDYERLEVSSPGLDRPVKKEADFARFAGQEIQIKVRIPLNGRRNFQGELLGLKGDKVGLRLDKAEIELDLNNIEKARLVPRFD